MTNEYRAQIQTAEALHAKDKAELERHARIGRTMCKCNDCFCCAAEHVRYAQEKIERDRLKFFGGRPI